MKETNAGWTPFILVNGYEWNMDYKIEDIQNITILEELI
jgi:hypothetical protein